MHKAAGWCAAQCSSTHQFSAKHLSASVGLLATAMDDIFNLSIEVKSFFSATTEPNRQKVYGSLWVKTISSAPSKRLLHHD